MELCSADPTNMLFITKWYQLVLWWGKSYCYKYVNFFSNRIARLCANILVSTFHNLALHSWPHYCHLCSGYCLRLLSKFKKNRALNANRFAIIIIINATASLMKWKQQKLYVCYKNYTDQCQLISSKLFLLFWVDFYYNIFYTLNWQQIIKKFLIIKPAFFINDFLFCHFSPTIHLPKLLFLFHRPNT